MSEGLPRESISSRERRDVDPFIQIAREVDEQSARLDMRTRLRLEEQANVKGFSLKNLEVEGWARERFPLKERTGGVHSQPVHFLGIAHTPETLLFQREAIETAIASAGAVVIEGAPEIAGIYEPEFLAKVEKHLRDRGHTETEARDWIQKRIVDDPPLTFFQEIEHLAKKHRKPVITCDPHSGADKDKELIFEWTEDRDRLKETAGAFGIGLLGAWASGAGASAIALIRNVLKNEERRRYETFQPEFVSEHSDMVPQPSRRQFLAGAAGLAFAGATAPSVLHSAGGGSSPYLLPYDFMDYRNVSVARGIDALTSNKRFDGPIVFIYGMLHADPIMKYLEDPEWGDAKYALYRPLRGTKPPELGVYEFAAETETDSDPTRYHWRQVVHQSV